MGSGPTWFGDVNIDVQKFKLPEGRVFVRCDALHLPFRDGVFDEVVSADVLEHVDSAMGYLLEAKRVLQDAGYLLLGTPNAFRILNFAYILLHDTYKPHKDHVCLYGRIELEQLIRKAGFIHVWVQAETYGDSRHDLISRFLLESVKCRKDLNERQLVAIAQKTGMLRWWY